MAPRTRPALQRRLSLAVVALATVAVGLLAASPTLAQSPPLDEVAGRLLAAPAPLGVGVETLGNFGLEAAASGADLRSAPGSAALQMHDGRIAGAAVRGNEVRNVDPVTGRPRAAGETGPCATGAEPACLLPGGPVDQNLQAFEDLCAFTRGASAVDTEACALDIFNSRASVAGPFTPALSISWSAIGSGQPSPSVIGGQGLFNALAAGFAGGVALDLAAIAAVRTAAGTGALTTPLIPLSNDGLALQNGDNGGLVMTGDPSEDIKFNPLIAAFAGLEPYLTPQQQALLGCGAFTQTRCDVDGIDLRHTEAAGFFQSFPPSFAPDWDTTDADLVQPGTLGFGAATPCVRPLGAGLTRLPGCRGPGDPGYDPAADGTLTGLDNSGLAPLRVHPFAGQPFASEMAVVSWNLLMGLVAFSGTGSPTPMIDHFDPGDPFRSDACSLARPGLCSAVRAFELLVTVERDDDPSGAPSRRWVWETGAQYSIDEATGVLAAFLGGRLHAAGPEVARVPGEPTGAAFFATLPDGVAAPDSPFVVRTAGIDRLLGTADDPALGAGYGVAAACGNGEDDDGDGLFDTDDPGCPQALAEPEDPTCDDGEDNDANGLTDFDDPKCSLDFPYGERRPCGLGAELLVLLLPWLWITRRRSRRIWMRASLVA